MKVTSALAGGFRARVENTARAILRGDTAGRVCRGFSAVNGSAI
jgi:hypothetical protein